MPKQMIMTDAYSAPEAAALGPVRARLQPHLTALSTGPHEVVEFYTAAVANLGVVVLPRDAAYDVVSRLEDTAAAASLNLITSRVAGHVRWWLHKADRDPADEPDDWTGLLIELIKDADEEQRRRLGRIYPDYVVCVAIATAPEGLQALRQLHQELLAAGPRTTAPSG